MTSTNQDNHVALLDGLRGAMAFWVFYGHLQIICLGVPPRFGHPAQAVDVFMFLSGFLMIYHWLGRQDKFINTLHQTWDFYVRRFFRIAPIYYLLFTVAYLGQNYFNAAGHQAALMLSAAPATNSDMVASPPHQSLLSAVLHYTFLFGAFPHYVSNNALPDWSIGLEMQFYALFPLLLIAISKWGSLTSVGLAIFITYTANHLFSLYDHPSGVLGNYPQPGFLPFKLDVFMGGICLAYSYRERLPGLKLYWILLAGICLLRTTVQVKALVFGTICLMELDRGRVDLFHRILSSGFGKFAGDTSYSVYLLHMLLICPILGGLLSVPWIHAQPKMIQFSISFFAVGIPLYFLAAMLHRYVEMPGIALGKRLVRLVANRLYPQVAIQSAVEKTSVEPFEVSVRS